MPDPRFAVPVNRGARLLDDRQPGWWWGIMTDRLRMEDPGQDVLAQLYGSYDAGLDVLSDVEKWSATARYNFAVRHGFNLVDPATATAKDWEELAEAWKGEIEKRMILEK